MHEPTRLSQELEDLAVQSQFMRFMDRHGVKTGVDLSTWQHLMDHEPLVQVAGREVVITNPHFGQDDLWRLRLQQFYKVTDQGLLYYYVPLPTELEIPESWRG